LGRIFLKKLQANRTYLDFIPKADHCFFVRKKLFTPIIYNLLIPLYFSEQVFPF